METIYHDCHEWVSELLGYRKLQKGPRKAKDDVSSTFESVSQNKSSERTLQMLCRALRTHPFLGRTIFGEVLKTYTNESIRHSKSTHHTSNVISLLVEILSGVCFVSPRDQQPKSTLATYRVAEVKAGRKRKRNEQAKLTYKCVNANTNRTVISDSQSDEIELESSGKDRQQTTQQALRVSTHDNSLCIDKSLSFLTILDLCRTFQDVTAQYDPEMKDNILHKFVQHLIRSVEKRLHTKSNTTNKINYHVDTNDIALSTATQHDRIAQHDPMRQPDSIMRQPDPIMRQPDPIMRQPDPMRQHSPTRQRNSKQEEDQNKYYDQNTYHKEETYYDQAYFHLWIALIFYLQALEQQDSQKDNIPQFQQHINNYHTHQQKTDMGHWTKNVQLSKKLSLLVHRMTLLKCLSTEMIGLLSDLHSRFIQVFSIGSPLTLKSTTTRRSSSCHDDEKCPDINKVYPDINKACPGGLFLSLFNLDIVAAKKLVTDLFESHQGTKWNLIESSLVDLCSSGRRGLDILINSILVWRYKSKPILSNPAIFNKYLVPLPLSLTIESLTNPVKTTMFQLEVIIDAYIGRSELSQLHHHVHHQLPQQDSSTNQHGSSTNQHGSSTNQPDSSTTNEKTRSDFDGFVSTTRYSSLTALSKLLFQAILYATKFPKRQEALLHLIR
eukprot:g308.t1